MPFLQSVFRERDSDIREYDSLLRRMAKTFNDTTEVGNVGTGEDDLITYSVPNGFLQKDGNRLEFEACIDLAANANSKQIKAYWGSQEIYDSTAQTQNGGTIIIAVTVIRTGAATQKVGVRVNTDASNYSNTANFIDGTQSLAAAVTFKCTGEATSDDDIVQEYLTVKRFES